MAALPAQMTAIAIRSPGGPEVLTAEPRPVPKPGDREILIKVAAAGVNRPDVMQRMGLIRRRRARPIFPAWKSAAKSSPAEPA
jgi:NADPH:quinone reductase-like Zn-dependent oxidoreductase